MEARGRGSALWTWPHGLAEVEIQPPRWQQRPHSVAAVSLHRILPGDALERLRGFLQDWGPALTGEGATRKAQEITDDVTHFQPGDASSKCMQGRDLSDPQPDPP